MENLYIFLMVLAGWLINHCLSIKNFADATPNLSFTDSVKGYFLNDPFGFIASAIAMSVISFLIIIGLSAFLSSILGIPVQFQTPELKFLIAFLLGMQTQRFIKTFTKTNPMDERTLPEPVKEKIFPKEELT